MTDLRFWTLVLAMLMGPAGAGAQVPYERLRAASSEPGAWLTYSGTYEGHRFSPLTEITPANVSRLRPVWVYQVQEAGPPAQVTPLVADGVMYVTETRSRVAALDLRTGRTLWRFEPEIPKTVKVIGFGPTNRGVALLDDRVYVGTLNAHLVALDAVSGAVRWDVEVADNKLGYAITSAPLAIDGKIVIGVSGGEAGIRGFLDAYDAKTGTRAWRFHTVPGPGEPGHDTWGGESWKTGGAPTWVTGSFDSALNLLYFGVGNPAPDWNGDNRPGDNLYSCSLIALDAATGKLRWHFQFTPHDTHDWDSNQIPVLIRRHHRGSATQAGHHGESQRVLLRPRSDNGRVPARHAVRETDMGERTRSARPANCHPRPGALRNGHAGVAQPAGRHQLVQSRL